MWHARPAIQQNKCKACRHGIILYEAEEKNRFPFYPSLSLFLKKALYLHATCHPPNYINASSKVADYLPIDHGSAKSLATRRGTSAGSERSICRQWRPSLPFLPSTPSCATVTCCCPAQQGGAKQSNAPADTTCCNVSLGVVQNKVGLATFANVWKVRDEETRSFL